MKLFCIYNSCFRYVTNSLLIFLRFLVHKFQIDELASMLSSIPLDMAVESSFSLLSYIALILEDIFFVNVSCVLLFIKYLIYIFKSHVTDLTINHSNSPGVFLFIIIIKNISLNSLKILRN